MDKEKVLKVFDERFDEVTKSHRAGDYIRLYLTYEFAKEAGLTRAWVLLNPVDTSQKRLRAVITEELDKRDTQPG